MTDQIKHDDIGLLIRDAGARELVSAARFDNARARVGDHWRGVVAAQRQQRRHNALRSFAIAAAVVAALAIAFLSWQPATIPGSVAVATVNRVMGNVLVDGASTSSGTTIAANSVLQTGDSGRVALELSTGQSLLMDTATRLIAGSDNRFVLEHGGIYVASGIDSRTDPVTVVTHLGVASEVGTQFQVRVSPDRLLIGVREGLVELERSSAPKVDIEYGRVFELSSIGVAQQRDIAAEDDIWEWTESIGPNFDINGATLHDYLLWYARERGVTVEWHDQASRARSQQTRLSGSIKQLSLDQGLQAVLRIAPFEYELTGKLLRVRVD
jgi:ferric-dicitrate binding protein FerR (iron transport regulator)